MSFSLDAYYKPNRLFLSAVGLWPHQSMMEKTIFSLITIFFIISQGYLQIGGMIMAYVDLDIFMESVPPVSIDFMCFVKIINFMYNADKMKELLEVMEADWKHIRTDEEHIILRTFGLDCRKKTLMYAGAVYGTMVPFMLVPLMGIFNGLTDTTLPVNETVLRPLMFHVEYLVDANKWYYYLLIHSYFATMAYITIVVAVDTTYMLYAQHACSLLAIVGYRLTHLVEETDLDVDMHPPISTDKPYHNLIQCISHHNLTLKSVSYQGDELAFFVEYEKVSTRAALIVKGQTTLVLQQFVKTMIFLTDVNISICFLCYFFCINAGKTYVEMIESAFTVSLLFQTSINMLCISFTGFQAVMKLDYPEESFRYATFMLAQFFPLFISSYPPQCVTTESEHILEFFKSSSPWYLTSIRTRKLLNLMILRLTKPCHLTAGRIFVLNIEYFSTVTRKSMSYLTMLCSFRETDE